MEIILNDIRKERARQDKKWGQQLHDPTIWLAILSEEVGEVSSAILCMKFEEYRNELIQVAAVAVAAIESFDHTKKMETK